MALKVNAVERLLKFTKNENDPAITITSCMGYGPF
jgi:hypothetical protein